MVRMDWDRILMIKAETLTDDEIEDLFPMVIRCDIDDVDNINNLRALMKLSQEMLQHKDNQVESLLLECDELKEKVSTLSASKKSQRKPSQVIEPGDIERDNSDSKQTDFSTDYQDTMKNDKIKTLLHELEALEKENDTLKKKLDALKEEMEDATENMNEMTEELEQLRSKNILYKEKIEQSKRENAALLIQIDELTNQQVDRDKAIDDFSEAIELRVIEWKNILEEKNAEIDRLQEELSHTVMQSMTSMRDQNKSEILYLNEEIDRRETIIVNLQTKLTEATAEINESAALIERLKTDAKKLDKTSRRQEHKNLLKKIQDSNEKISMLQDSLQKAENDLTLKSEQLCETLGILRKYEDKERGLADTIKEVKNLKEQLLAKNNYVQDLINVINNLEALNSSREMQILALREKLGMPEDEKISINSVVLKSQEEARIRNELVEKNEKLEQENIEMKSDLRTLRYKMSRLGERVTATRDIIDTNDTEIHSKKIIDENYHGLVDENLISLQHRAEIDEIKDNVRFVIEENEALRKGMHEILDSIHDQDGKSRVDVQSDTLERLLEALDVRHIAGWYHPAMRLQERLNVIQGSNSELRLQLKQMRKELQKKDELLRKSSLKIEEKKNSSEEETDEAKHSEKLHIYENELEKIQKERELLSEENEVLRESIEKLSVQLEIFQRDFKILESDESEIKNSLASKSIEIAEFAMKLITSNRKCSTLENLLKTESSKVYKIQKESIDCENAFRKAFIDMDKRSKILENEILTLQSNLSNSISIIEYTELKEKYEELIVRLRAAYEVQTVLETEENLINIKSDENPRNLDKSESNLESVINMNSELREQLIDLQKELSKKMNPQNLSDVQNSINLKTLYTSLQPKLEKSESNLESVINMNSELREQLIDLQNELSKQMNPQNLSDVQNSINFKTLYTSLQPKLEKSESNLESVINMNSELREQLIDLQKELSKMMNPQNSDDTSLKLKEQIRVLKIDNEHLSRTLETTREEAQMHYTINSLKTFELDSLRHQILDLHSVSEDKYTIARLGFELTNCKSTEIELSKIKVQLENDIQNLRSDLTISNKKLDEMRMKLQDCQKNCLDRCRSYEDIIDFMRHQYATSTSVSNLERFYSMLKNLVNSRKEIQTNVEEANKLKEIVKSQQELLKNRLEIVEKLKDILEEQIGSSNVENFMHSFSENSQCRLNEIRLKRRISQLETELKSTNNKLLDYESTIIDMETEMMNIQRIWYKKSDATSSVSETRIVTKVVNVEKKSISVEARVKNHSVEVQSEPYDFYSKIVVPEVPIKESKKSSLETDDSHSVIKEQLNDALALASERSSIIIKFESQIAEYQSKIMNLEKTIADKDFQLSNSIDQILKTKKKSVDDHPIYEDTDKAALKSTINSLQKMLNQKEETISRYQNLLKDDRDEHSKAASRFQEEIKGLREEINKLHEESEKRYETISISGPVNTRIVEEPIKEPRPDIEAEEKIARLCERVSTLEADLNIAKELSERWHRLAEERLQHMDHMRKRLEEQHKNELESYRLELNKWQNEADILGQQLSENRMQLAKGNISMVKELQERDNKIQELSVAYQQLQSEFEMMESMTLSQPMVVHGNCSTKMQEMAQALNRDQANHFQSELDHLRRQIKSQTDKEKIYKDQIADLKQQLSRKYMAAKSEERRISNREMQLERKLKTLEEELHKARIQLDREYRVQEAKRIKTAEELSLWEKQKKWQQIAEKLKKELKEKAEDYKKLNTSYEKLRAVVSCMEREKWYLRSKLRMESGNVGNNLASNVNELQYKIVENLQIECKTLRDRIKELTDRLESEDNRQLIQELEHQRRRINAMETVNEGNEYVIDKLEKLEATKSMLEKSNIRLESENFQLRMELEKSSLDTPRLREKVEHLEKYVELLKIEKSSESSPRSLDKELTERKKSVVELEKTVFMLKRVVEKLQVENKRLKMGSKSCHRSPNTVRVVNVEEPSTLKRQYEHAQKRVVALEADLQLAEQRIVMLENARKEDDNTSDVNVLRQQLAHKSELLDKVKQLLARAAINEKSLRQRIQQIEMKQTLSTIAECSVKSSSPN